MKTAQVQSRIKAFDDFIKNTEKTLLEAKRRQKICQDYLEAITNHETNLVIEEMTDLKNIGYINLILPFRARIKVVATAKGSGSCAGDYTFENIEVSDDDFQMLHIETGEPVDSKDQEKVLKYTLTNFEKIMTQLSKETGIDVMKHIDPLLLEFYKKYLIPNLKDIHLWLSDSPELYEKVLKYKKPTFLDTGLWKVGDWDDDPMAVEYIDHVFFQQLNAYEILGEVLDDMTEIDIIDKRFENNRVLKATEFYFNKKEGK